jgi:hypothetical protein
MVAEGFAFHRATRRVVARVEEHEGSAEQILATLWPPVASALNAGTFLPTAIFVIWCLGIVTCV